MRLAVVETSSQGGLLHYATQMADGLAGIGHDVDLVVTRGNEMRAHEGPARRLAVLTPHVRSAAAAPAGRVAYQLRRAGIAARLTRSWARIVWTVLRGRYDAVITGSDITTPIGIVGMRLLLAAPRRPPVLLVIHNVRPFNRWGGEGLFLDRLERRLERIYARADVVAVHGERSQQEYEERWPKRPLTIISFGDLHVFANEPPPAADEERVLFFGDWRKVKGLPVLMDAFDILVSRRPSARLTIAGTPAPADFDPEPVRAWAATHRGNVRLVERYTPIEEVPALFATARVVVTPYLAGYQSAVMRLAQTMGRAVVTSDAGDLPASVQEGVTGLVVPIGDAEALAKALEMIVADPELARDMGRAARDRLAVTASWKTVAEELELALADAVGGR